MIRRGMQVMGLALGLGLAGTAVAQDDNKQGDLNVFLRGGVSDYTGDLGSDMQAAALAQRFEALRLAEPFTPIARPFRSMDQGSARGPRLPGREHRVREPQRARA